jgi:hypothetical protein
LASPGGVGVDPVPQFARNQIDPDAAGPVIQVTEDALAVYQLNKHGHLINRVRDPDQRHHVRERSEERLVGKD